MFSTNTIEIFLIWLVPVLLAITVHEWAHGFVANRLGDNTAKQLGRLTLNPIKHIDPIGTILVPSLLFFSSGFLFGWAKPVPINASQLRNAKNSIVLVALAGPGINFIMAILWAIFYYFASQFNSPNLTLVGLVGIQINFVLAILNMLPIPPLDGSILLARFLPTKLKFYYQKSQKYGFIILIMLLLTGVLSAVLLPSVNFLTQIIT